MINSYIVRAELHESGTFQDSAARLFNILPDSQSVGKVGSLPIISTCLFGQSQSTMLHSCCKYGQLHMYMYLNLLKWYYDQKIISFFSSDFESVFT